MDYVGHHATKINRAAKLSTTGAYYRTFCAMLDAIPASTISALTAKQLGELIDAMSDLTSTSKAIAVRGVCDEGSAWDARTGNLRELA